jgi:hypothetical protein
MPNNDNMELFLSIPQEQSFPIRQLLLEALAAETNSSVRNKIGDAIAELARQYSDNSKCDMYIWLSGPFV